MFFLKTYFILWNYLNKNSICLEEYRDKTAVHGNGSNPKLLATTMLVLPVVGKSIVLISDNSYTYLTNRLNCILVQLIPSYSMCSHNQIFGLSHNLH
jgi:hypothetical protein